MLTMNNDCLMAIIKVFLEYSSVKDTPAGSEMVNELPMQFYQVQFSIEKGQFTRAEGKNRA